MFLPSIMQNAYAQTITQYLQVFLDKSCCKSCTIWSRFHCILAGNRCLWAFVLGHVGAQESFGLGQGRISSQHAQKPRGAKNTRPFSDYHKGLFPTSLCNLQRGPDCFHDGFSYNRGYNGLFCIHQRCSFWSDPVTSKSHK